MTVENPCLSGGALEIFLEPWLPLPRVGIVGETPVALALRSVGSSVGYEVGDVSGEDIALVVASHGRDEEEALESALVAGVPYVGLVASRRRGAAVLDELRSRRRVPSEDVDRVRTPAGLDIGARTAEEIALSILAEIVSVRRAQPVVSRDAAAIDPICGMEVVAAAPSLSVEHDGQTVWFCGEGCKRAFEADVARR